jgi:hypothetical protein
MPVLPPVVAVALGGVAGAVLARLLVREWRRVNDELDRVRAAPPGEAERAEVPTLRRDPATGVYRLQR